MSQAAEEYDVYVTRRLPAPGIGLLTEAGLTVNLRDETSAAGEDELTAGISGARAILPMITDPIDATLIEGADRLEVIANLGVGYNNIDLDSAAAAGVVVSNTPDVLAEATADLAWTLILAVARKVVPGDRLARSGEWAGWDPTELLGIELAGKTLGILGMGAIGSAVAKRATGFGMRVIYHNRRPSKLEGASNATLVNFEELLDQSDVLSLHVPLNDSTKGIIGETEFARMMPSSILINTGRGPLVDEPALIAALESKQISGAGLDVYAEEPAIPAGLRSLENAVLLPHLGSATDQTRRNMVTLACRNIIAVLAGSEPITPVPIKSTQENS